MTTVDGETTVENTLDAIPRLVRVGAKQPDQLNWLEPLPFKVIATENPNLPAGEHKMIQEGKPGLVQHVGDTATTVTEPQDYILEIGTAKDLQEKREVITEPIPFETIFVEDDTLAAGVVKVDTHGENGAKRTTKVCEMKDGKGLESLGSALCHVKPAWLPMASELSTAHDPASRSDVSWSSLALAPVPLSPYRPPVKPSDAAAEAPAALAPRR